MHYGSKYITSRRCDVPMRRSKERCRKPNGKPWRCTGECKSCICSIYKTDNGTEHHNNTMSKRFRFWAEQDEDWTL